MLLRAILPVISIGLPPLLLPTQLWNFAPPAAQPIPAAFDAHQIESEQVAQSPSAAPAKPDPSWQPGTVTSLRIPDPDGSSSPVRSLAFSPDGGYLLSGGADRVIRVWNLQARSLERTLSSSSDQISEIAISPDGRLLASGSLDGTVRVWNWQTGQLLHTLNAHSDDVTAVAFSPDSQVLGSAGADKTIQLWNPETGALQRTIVTNQWIETIAFSPDNSTLASAGLERAIELWNWQTGEPIRTLTAAATAIYAIAFSPDGQRLAFSPNARQFAGAQPENLAESNTIQVIDLEGEPVGQPLTGHTDYITSIAFSPNGQVLVSGSWDKTAKIWNPQTGELIHDLPERTERILSLCFRSDGRAFAMGSGDGTITIFLSEE